MLGPRVLLSAAVLVMLVCAVSITEVYARTPVLTFSPTITLTNGVSPCFQESAPAVVSGAYVYVAWSSCSNDGVTYTVNFRDSTDSGKTWSSITTLGSTKEPVQYLALVAIGLVVHVAWIETSCCQEPEHVWYRRSTDNGVSWTSPTLISSPDNSAQYQTIRMAILANNVYLLWVQLGIPGADERDSIIFRRSINRGTTFEQEKTLANDSGQPDAANLAVSGRTLHVFYNGLPPTGNADFTSKLSYVRSLDNGTSFQPEKTLVTVPFGIDRIQIAASGTRIFAVWEDYSVCTTTGSTTQCFPRIALISSVDNGGTFKPMKILSPTAPPNNSEPQLAVSGNYVYVAWITGNSCDDIEEQPMNCPVLYRRSSDGGSTWGNIVTMNSKGFNIRLWAYANFLYFTWADKLTQDNVDIFMRASMDHGASFTSKFNVSNNAGFSLPCEVVGSKTKVYMVWTQWASASATNVQLLIRRANVT